MIDPSLMAGGFAPPPDPLMMGPPTFGMDPMAAPFSQPPQFPFWSGQPDVLGGASPDLLAKLITDGPPDPAVPLRDRPSLKVLRDRKEYMLRFWRPRNLRMVDDQNLYYLRSEVPERVGQEEIGASEKVILNEPYVLVEKIANMISAEEPVIEKVSLDPGMKEIAQKCEDFLYWWRDETSIRWSDKLNNAISRDEVYYFALRGWLAGRVMLDPGDPDFPWRYDLVDPIHVYPQIGPKGLNWVFHIYKDAKINVLNDFGWDNGVLQKIEEKLNSYGSYDSIEISSYFDDVWHILLINDEEVWAAPHNYGFVPFIIRTAYGSPIRQVDPQFAGGTQSWKQSAASDYTAHWGVSVFEGIKEVYQDLNRIVSAIFTEAMKAPNPPVVIYTDNATGQAEAKTIDTSVGATNYLIQGTEDFKVVQYGFNPSELAPLLQILQDARNRGTLPQVMFGEGANYLSGFAVSLLQSGSRDVVLPIIRAHEHYLMSLFRAVLKLTAEIYPFPVNMIETDPSTGSRTQMTTITGDDIKAVGYTVKVVYKNVMPQDKAAAAQMAAMLVDKKIISLDTARGTEFLGLPNPTLENKKVLGDLAYFDPLVVQNAIPWALLTVDPQVYLLHVEAEQQKRMQEAQQFQMMMMTGQAPPGPGGPNGQPPPKPGGPGAPPGGPGGPPGQPPKPASTQRIAGQPY